MKGKRKIAFFKELRKAKFLIKCGYYDKAFVHLERAHVIGQRFVVPHFLSHWHMFRIGIFKMDLKEVFGQLIRMPLGIIGSLIGVIPLGNTGGANIGLFDKRKIPKDLDFDKQ